MVFYMLIPLNGMYYYVLFHVSDGYRYFLLVYFYKEFTGMILRMSFYFSKFQ